MWINIPVPGLGQRQATGSVGWIDTVTWDKFDISYWIDRALMADPAGASNGGRLRLDFGR